MLPAVKSRNGKQPYTRGASLCKKRIITMFTVPKIKWINYSKEFTTIALLFNLGKKNFPSNEKYDVYLYNIIMIQVG